MVYHYTSIDALWHLIESIKDSKDKDSFIFRATHIMFMNDPQEFIYGQEVLRNVLIQIENELGIDNEYRLSKFWNEAENEKHDTEMFFLNFFKSSNEIPYVISFSKLEDNLQMWLNYGNSGRGVNLVFEDNRDQPYALKFKNGKRIPYESFYTSDVHYKVLSKKSSLYKLIRDTLKEYKEDIDRGFTEFQEAYLEALILLAAPLIKTSFYENENEVRLIKTVSDGFSENVQKINFRSNGNHNLIPFIDVEIPHNQLKAVRIGPLANYELTKMALELMKKKYDLQFDIIQSEVKYREY